MPFESDLRTDRDMECEDNRKEAAWRLERCVTDADYAAWAKAYGRVLCAVEIVDVDSYLTDLQEKDDEIKGLESAIDEAIEDFTEALKTLKANSGQ